LRVSL